MTNEPPQSDKELIASLQALLGTVATLRSGLYTRRAGCACDDRGLCAHHAQVSNRLITVADELARAIRDTQRVD